jgi:DNA-binding CsgD family transcriptional regulator/catechol 2,3-dioxygenase-like lactoylglutathione lyase family enzyme
MGKLRRGRPRHEDVLTPAEWRVVHAVKHGLSNREIARRLGVSLDGVKYHVANAVEKLDLSSRNDLKQWHRAPRSSALNRGGAPERGMDSKEKAVSYSTKFGALGQIARSVRDIKASEAWYRDVLGLPHLFTFGTLAFFDCAGTRLMLSQEASGPAAESLLYWRVADIAAAHAALKSRGVEFINAPHMIFKHPDGTEEWLSIFKDAEGRPLGLISQVAP